MAEIDKRVHTLNNVFERLESILDVLKGRRDETNRDAIEVLEIMIENASTVSYQEALIRLDTEGLSEYYKKVTEFVLVLAKQVGILELSLMEGTASSAFYVPDNSNAGNNLVQFVPSYGQQSSFFMTPEEFLYFVVQETPFLRELISALQGDNYSQELLKYAFHQIARDALQGLSDTATGVSLAFLAVGSPQGSAIAGGISLAAEALLVIDDFMTGNLDEAWDRGLIIVAGVLGGKVTKLVTGQIAKGINVIVGKTGRYYALGRQGAMTSSEGMLLELKKELAGGYFGHDLAPAIQTLIARQAMEAYNEHKRTE